MTIVALSEALLCLALSLMLVRMAWRRLGDARFALRASVTDLSAAEPGVRKLAGVLEPSGALVLAPFSERPVLYARARLRGVGPDGGPARILWDKILTSPAKICDHDGSLPIDLRACKVLVPRSHRQGALRALVPAIRLIPRVLARAGYIAAPPGTQWFYLEEEVITAGERVSVIGTIASDGTLVPPLIISTLTPLRIVLRTAWGPAFAMLMAAIISLTGAVVVATWWWLR